MSVATIVTKFLIDHPQMPAEDRTARAEKIKQILEAHIPQDPFVAITQAFYLHDAIPDIDWIRKIAVETCSYAEKNLSQSDFDMLKQLVDSCPFVSSS